ncbi:MAG: PD-(D/E)XK nuclease family protein [Candidatus Izemoplasmatales bacterium]
MAIFMKSIETLPYDAILVTRAIDKRAFLYTAHKSNRFVSQKFISPNDYRAKIAPDFLAFMKTDFFIDPYYAAKMKPFLNYVNSSMLDHSEKIAFLIKIRERLQAEGKYEEAKTLLFDDHRIFSVNDDLYDPLLEKYQIRRLTTFLPLKTPIIINECIDKDAEIRAVLENTATLISSGVDINNIKIINAQGDDSERLKIDADGYGFAIFDRHPRSLFKFPLTIKVLKQSENESLKSILESIKSHLVDCSEIEIRVFVGLMGIVNDYGTTILDNNHDIFRYETEVRTIKVDDNIDGVEIINFDEVLPDQKNHYLLMNYLDSDFPVFRKDNDYLSDNEKRMLGLRTSIEENDIIRNEVETFINGVPNLVLFYAKKNIVADQRPSDLVIDRVVHKKFIVTEVKSKSFSLENDRRLYAKRRLNREKYGVTTSDFSLLHATFASSWSQYSAQFSGIDTVTIENLVKKGITLSATSLMVFRQCHFRFLLQYVLRLEQTEQSLELSLGNLAHYVLSHVIYSPNTIDEYANEYITSDPFLNDDVRHHVLANLFVSRLKIVSQYLVERNKNSAFSDLAVEQIFTYLHPDDPDFRIMGKIDLIKILAKADMNYCIVIDYKTGSKQFSDEEFLKGLDIQLLFYLHLLIKSGAIKAIKPVGFFFQPINIGRINKNPDKDPFLERLKLEGRLVRDYEVAKLFAAEDQVHGIAYKNNGDFRINNHLIEEEKINNYLQIMDGFIRNAVKDIKNGEFTISPLPIDHSKPVSESCEFCSFKSICYLANTNPDVNTIVVETEDD